LTKKKKVVMEDRVLNSLSIGITWIDGRIIFKHGKKWGNAFYGVCHFSNKVWAITPLDWDKMTMVTTIKVSPTEDYCSRAFSCLAKTCILNRFDKFVYAAEFKDCGLFSLGLPNSFSDPNTTPWFAEGKYKDFWGKFVLQGSGGILRFDENKAEKILNE